MLFKNIKYLIIIYLLNCNIHINILQIPINHLYYGLIKNILCNVFLLDICFNVIHILTSSIEIIIIRITQKNKN